MPNYRQLRNQAIEVRRDIIEMAFSAPGQSHPGPALSCADIVTALYFEHLSLRPEEPRWECRDRFIMSKGHACPALYAALAGRGYFGREHYTSFRGVGGLLQGHPEMKRTPGVDMTTGSLGNGLSAGVGMAYGLKMKVNPACVYVLLGDGETQEGIVWEAAMLATQMGLDNLIAIIDYNRWQSCGATDDVICMDPLDDKWKAFGWHVDEMDGHNMEDIVVKLGTARRRNGKPSVIIAHTIKGKGVSFMENDNSWHSRRPSREQYERAMQELEGVCHV